MLLNYCPPAGRLADAGQEAVREFAGAVTLRHYPVHGGEHGTVHECAATDDGDADGAAACFQRVAKHALTAPRRNPELLEGIVRDSLLRLFDLHCETDGAIPFPPEFPKPEEPEQKRPDEPIVISLIEMDLESEEGWDILTAICLTGQVPEDVQKREKRRAEYAMRQDRTRALPTLLQELSPAISGAPCINRNDPCPCGSGKKYKRCCGSG